MKVNLNQVFKSYDGSDLCKSVEIERFGKIVKEKEPVMIADQLAMHLYLGNGLEPGKNQQEDHAEKFAAFKLSQRIINTKTPIELSIEECALIKKVAFASFNPGAYGQVVELLENKEE